MGRGTNGIFGKQFGLGFGVDRCQFMKNDTVVAVVQDPAKCGSAANAVQDDPDAQKHDGRRTKDIQQATVH